MDTGVNVGKNAYGNGRYVTSKLITIQYNEMVLSLQDYFNSINRFDLVEAEEHANFFGDPERNILLSFIDFLRGNNLRGLERAKAGRESRDMLFRGLSYLYSGYHYYFLGQINRFFEEVSRAERFVDSFNEYAMGLYNHLKGLVARVRGDTIDAKIFYKRALSIRKEIGDYWGAGITLTNLAFMSLAGGKIQDALDLNLEARRLFEEAGSLVMIAFSDANRAIMELHLGNFDVADHLLRSSLKLYEEADAPAIYELSAKKTYAQVFFQKGRREDAISLLEEALNTYNGEKDSPIFIDLLTELVHLKIRDGRNVQKEWDLLIQIEPRDPSSRYKKLTVQAEIFSQGSLIEKVKGLLLAEDALKDLPNLEEGLDIQMNLLQVSIETRLELLGYDLDRKSIEVLEMEIDKLSSFGEREGALRYKVSGKMYKALIHHILGESLVAERYIQEALELAMKGENKALMDQVEEKVSHVKDTITEAPKSKFGEIIEYIRHVNEIIREDRG